MKKRKMIISLAVFFALILIYVIGYYLPLWKALPQKGIHDVYLDIKNQNALQSKSAVEGGLVSVSNKELFYINEADDNKVYKADLVSQTKSVFIDESVKSLCLYDDWIYYITDAGKLSRIKADGGDMTQLAEDATRNLIVTEEWVYFLANKKLDDNKQKDSMELNVTYGTYIYKVNKDGSNLSSVGEICSDKFTVDGDKVFYLESKPASITDFASIEAAARANLSKEVYMMNADGTNNINTGIKTGYTFAARDGWFYYIDKIAGTTCKSRISDGTMETLKLCDFPADSLHISGDHIFFSKEKTTKSILGIKLKSKLYRADTDGRNLVKVTEDDGIDDIYTTGDSIFYHTLSISPAYINKINVISEDGKDKQLLVLSIF